VKILFNHSLPFMLAHGGTQTQIEQTQAALQRIGVEVEPLRWWDDTQQGDILQHFGRLPLHIIHLAQEKGMKVVLSELLTEMGSRSASQLRRDRQVRQIMKRVFPKRLLAAYDWESYRQADACVALTGWEAQLLVEQFGAPAGRVHVVPNGVEEVFLNSRRVQRGPWLVCTATVTPRKRVVELAEAVALARTPLWVIGKPYSESDAYGQQFLRLVKENAEVLRYEGAISDRAKLAQIYRESRGFVLVSAMESLSLSALEAAACECPLLLSDLPWARTVFGMAASYCSIKSPTREAAGALRKFYDAAPRLGAPARPLTWHEVAEKLEGIYQRLVGPRP
jgi:glycosyltransferase involved in cell wall biosynthesis